MICGALLACACAKEPARDAPPPLTATQGLTAKPPAALLDVGEDCSKFAGNDACAQGVCLRVLPGIPPTGYCSVSCKPDEADACPDGPTPWACQQIWPSEQGWFCVPDLKWKGQRATLKGKPMPVKVSAAPAPAAVSDGGAP